jgi:2,3-bisphosphoglycerate-dependent phosphoglycerate mutase
VALTLFLVRHGESGWNRDRRVQGQSLQAPGLTDLGRTQAAGAAAEFTAIGAIDRIVTSDLVRAVETATIIGAAIGVSAEPDPRLREQAMGALEGLLSADAWGELQGVDWTDATRLGGPAGETGYDVQARVGSLLADLVAAEAAGGPSRVVVVSHGGAVRRLVGLIAATAPDVAPEWDENHVANCSITTRVLDGGVLVG